MTIYLVRHARAGNRNAWLHDDELRPLSVPGHEQARGLIRALRDAEFEHVLSSPYVRCMETRRPARGRAPHGDRTRRRARRGSRDG